MTLYAISGWGKAKTTSAIGITMRALANNERVLFVQFLKDGNDLALRAISKLEQYKNIFVYKVQGLKGFDISNKEPSIAYFKVIQDYIRNNEFDLIVLDELNVLQDYYLTGLTDEQLLEYLKLWVGIKSTDMYITGRINRHSLRHAIFALADIASNVRCEAHAYNKICKDCGMEFTPHYVYCPICGRKLTGGHRAKKGREY